MDLIPVFPIVPPLGSRLRVNVVAPVADGYDLWLEGCADVFSYFYHTRVDLLLNIRAGDLVEILHANRLLDARGGSYRCVFLAAYRSAA